jgi:hypothetical protein
MQISKTKKVEYLRSPTLPEFKKPKPWVLAFNNIRDDLRKQRVSDSALIERPKEVKNTQICQIYHLNLPSDFVYWPKQLWEVKFDQCPASARSLQGLINNSTIHVSTFYAVFMFLGKY